jgi:lysozyme family protein
VKAVQRKVGGCAVDGYWGYHTSKALQWWLAGKGCNPGAIDGVFGPESVKALQRSLNKGLWR